MVRPWRLWMAVGMALAGLGAAGCFQDGRAFVGRERLEAGLVISLDGVGGYNWGPRWLRSGLDEAGIRSAILIYDWSRGPGGMFVADLMDETHNRAAADNLAQLVATYVAAMPNRPVTLIGHSGGAAVVVWALEAMPPNCQVARVILLAPALAPDYDLTKALRAVRGRLYAMYSQADVGFMAAGTAVFGTMDRRHSVSAGLVGFSLPPALAAEGRIEYAKVRLVRWTPELLKSGNYGGHMGWTTTRFARDFIAPILAGQSDPGVPLVRPAARPATQHAQTGGSG